MATDTAEFEHYMNQNYAYTLTHLPGPEGGRWLAEHRALHGCASTGATEEEAIRNLKDAKAEWILTMLREGQKIPDAPEPEEEYSGRLTIRIPKPLHRSLAESAEEQGVSLNQLILYRLSYNEAAARHARVRGNAIQSVATGGFRVMAGRDSGQIQEVWVAQISGWRYVPVEEVAR